MNLEEIRTETDKIDDEIAKLFEQRLQLVASVAKVKAETHSPILKPTREREIISRLTARHGELSADYLKLLFTTIFDVSRSHQIVLTNRSSKIDTTQPAGRGAGGVTGTTRSEIFFCCMETRWDA